MHEPGFDDDQPDWDYLMSKDNKTVEELSKEEISLLREYKNNQKEIYDSGLPSYLVDIYSSDRVIHPLINNNCIRCDKVFVVDDNGHENNYCSRDCMLSDQSDNSW